MWNSYLSFHYQSDKLQIIFMNTFMLDKIMTVIPFHLKEADTEAANPVPLNHNAAHHKIAVRPKRTHGLPRRRVKQVSLFYYILKYL